MADLKAGDRIGGARTASLRRVERALVRGLAEEFGKGRQSQVTRDDGFTIAIESEGAVVVIDVREDRG